MATVPEIPYHNFYVIRFYTTNECVVIPRTWILSYHGRVAYMARPPEITRGLVEDSGPRSITWPETLVKVDEGFENSTEAYDYLNRITESDEAEQQSEPQPTWLIDAQTLITKSHENSAQLAGNRNPNILLLGKTPKQNMSNQKSPDNQKRKKSIPGLMPLTYRKQSKARASADQNITLSSFEGSDNASPKPSTSKGVTTNNTTQGTSTNKNQVNDVHKKREPKKIETEILQVSTQELSKPTQKEHALSDLSTNVLSKNNESSKEVEAAKEYLLKMHISLNRKNRGTPCVSRVFYTPLKANLKEQESIKTINHRTIVNQKNRVPEIHSKSNMTANPTTPANSNAYENQKYLSEYKNKLIELRKSLESEQAVFKDMKMQNDHMTRSAKKIWHMYKARRMMITKLLRTKKVENELTETNQNSGVPK